MGAKGRGKSQYCPKKPFIVEVVKRGMVEVVKIAEVGFNGLSHKTGRQAPNEAQT